MMMLDYVMLAVLAYFALWGFRKGLIQAIGSIIGLIIAVVLASRYFQQAADAVSPFVSFTKSENFIKVIVFVLMLIIINRLAVFVFSIIEKMYKSVAILPGMKFLNRLLGAGLGFIEGCLVLGLIIFFASRFPFGSIVESFLAGSQIAPIVLQISTIIQPFIPEAIKQIQGLI